MSKSLAQSLIIGLSCNKIVSHTELSDKVDKAESSKRNAEVINAVADLALVI